MTDTDIHKVSEYNRYRPDVYRRGIGRPVPFDETKCAYKVVEPGLGYVVHQCTRARLEGLEICSLHKRMIDNRIAKAEKNRLEALQEDAQRQVDKHQAEALNARVEALTGEPSHLRVRSGEVQGLTVDDLHDILGRAEFAVKAPAAIKYNGLTERMGG